PAGRGYFPGSCLLYIEQVGSLGGNTRLFRAAGRAVGPAAPLPRPAGVATCVGRPAFAHELSIGRPEQVKRILQNERRSWTVRALLSRYCPRKPVRDPRRSAPPSGRSHGPVPARCSTSCPTRSGPGAPP